MSEQHQTSSSIIDGKDQMEYQEASSSLFDDDTLEQSASYCEAREEEEEEQVHLGPRCDSRLEDAGDEHDQYSIQAACTDSSMGSDYDRDDSSYIQVIPHPVEDSCTKRSFLCRSLAWSQDSLDERVAKKYRSEESSPTSHSESLYTFSFEQPHHRRQRSTESLHWEEKVVNPFDLITFIQSSGVANA
jgi:hypothetical protein